VISTRRLRLIPGTPELIRAALESDSALASGLGAVVPPTWPPEFVDPPALRFAHDRLTENAAHDGWWFYFLVLPDEAGGPVLAGLAGYKGPPSEDGTVEVGYSIVEDRQGRGYASEAVRGLVQRAFAEPGVRRVIAETLPELAASVAVLRKCGFHFVGDGSEPGVVRYELTRAQYSPGNARS
jgi:RimJ/RimL family protein N-acetyltransferase